MSVAQLVVIFVQPRAAPATMVEALRLLVASR